MSYSYLGAAPPPEVVEPRPSAPGLPPDVAPTLAHEMLTPVNRRRGWVAVPTYDMREYVKAQILTAAAGFMVGIGIGAALGNILRGRDVASTVAKVVRNRRTSRRMRRRRTQRNHRRKRKTSRRTSARRRKRGRPAGGSVTELLTVTMDGMPVTVTIDRSIVRAFGRKRGSVHDLGTSYRAVPIGGEARSYGTLAGAVKHVIRKTRAA